MLCSAAYVHFGLRYFVFRLGQPTNEGLHKGPSKPSYATDMID